MGDAAELREHHVQLRADGCFLLGRESWPTIRQRLARDYRREEVVCIADDDCAKRLRHGDRCVAVDIVQHTVLLESYMWAAFHNYLGTDLDHRPDRGRIEVLPIFKQTGKLSTQ